MNASPDGLPPLRDVIAAHGLSAKKGLGQHFLLDLNVTRRIARAAGPLDQVIEVGPGPGGLTRALLLEGARRVIAIERDPRCLDALAEIAARWPDRLQVIEADALEVDPQDLLGAARGKVVSNLPYNVGTELLVSWLRGRGKRATEPGWWDGLTLMFQREVADRITAAPGSKAYGRLALLTAWRGRAQRVIDLPAQAFTPPPKVASAVVRIEPAAAAAAPCAFDSFERVTAAAFGQRRKMLRASLRALDPEAERWVTAAGLDPTARAETLNLDEFRRLAAAYEQRHRPGD